MSAGSKQKEEKSLNKYLSQYAEPETHTLESFPALKFQYGLVIPIYQEASTVFDRFTRFAESNTGTLLILVINRPDTSDTVDISWGKPFLNTSKKVLWHNDAQTITLQSLDNDSAVLIIDRCIKGKTIPEKQGVGLARKIGADILCQLIQQHIVLSPWIANTDADALLPGNYFSALNNIKKNTAAIIYPFEHIYPDGTDHQQQQATQLYELSLHYYVAGLRWANSPYSYHTIGSTIAVHYQYYAKVRGFPKRAGAEDFYLLNKLTKTGVILSLDTPVIDLITRASDRVPFGTGPAVNSIMALDTAEDYSLYHPASFHYLKLFLCCLDSAAALDSLPDFNQLITKANTNPLINAQQLTTIANKLNTQAALEHSFQQGKNHSVRIQHLHHWFDGFKTLKFIHYLRDDYLGEITIGDYLKNQRSEGYNYFSNERTKQLIKIINARA
jgi:hypothetical protein